MQINLLLILSFLAQTLLAQTFTEFPQTPPLEPVGDGSIAFSDVNGDNYPDVLITGGRNSDNPIAKLYINDGLGNFTEVVDTPFEGVARSSIAFSDVNGDNYPDVLITGINSLNTPTSKLYTNDGLGNFTEVLDTPIEDIGFGSIAFSDVNEDNYPDVLITGQNTLGTRTSKLYTNDGLGNFTEVLGTPFEEVDRSAIAFSDVNGDNYPDVLITGSLPAANKISKLYTNDGLGNFTEVLNSPFEEVNTGSVAFSDVNGDDSPDVLITGSVGPFFISKLYTNDGLGNFTEALDTPFEEVDYGSVAFSDVNGDNYPDVLITGINILFEENAKLYINDGLGNFTEVLDAPFEDVWLSSIAFSDVNGDNYPDVLITGSAMNGNVIISKLYTNDGITSSIKESIISDNLDFILYPNLLNSGNQYINYYSAGNGLITVKIYDSNGHLLNLQEKVVVIGQQTFSIDITSLPQGSYFAQLNDGKRIGVANFIVQ